MANKSATQTNVSKKHFHGQLAANRNMAE